MFARSPRLAPSRAGVRRKSETASVAAAPPGRSLPPRLSAGLRSTGAYVAVAVAVVAALPRFYQLDSVPAGLSAIERVFAAAASRVAHEGWIGLGPDAVAGEPPGFAYLLGAWSLLAGDSTVAMRLLPSSLGVATVGLFYLLTRRLLGAHTALFASVILALSFWHLQFSRLILPTILMLVAALAAANLLAAAIDEECSDVRRRALAAAAGLIIGGKQPVCLLQNTGMFESGDSIRGLGLDVNLPVVMVIGYRGWTRHGNTPDSAARFTEPFLHAFGINYYLVEDDADADRFTIAFDEARAQNRPVAVLVGDEYHGFNRPDLDQVREEISRQ